MRYGVLILYTLFIGYMTLLVRESGDQRSNMSIFWSYRQFITDANLRKEIINNILLFIPLGALLYALWPRHWMWCIAVVLSIVIESTQYISGLGLCEIDDVISNGFGGLIGYGVERLIIRYRLKTRKRIDYFISKLRERK